MTRATEHQYRTWLTTYLTGVRASQSHEYEMIVVFSYTPDLPDYDIHGVYDSLMTTPGAHADKNLLDELNDSDLNRINIAITKYIVEGGK